MFKFCFFYLNFCVNSVYLNYLTGDIFRRRLSSAEIIFGGDNFRRHFCQISALISAEMFSNIKFSTVAMNIPSYFYPVFLRFYSCMYDLFHSRVEQYLLLGVNFGCDGADDVIYFTNLPVIINYLGLSPSVLLPIDRLKSHYQLRIRL